jgi:hypothetical protein
LLARREPIPDPRDPRKRRHKLTSLLLYGLLMFVFPFSSRRETHRELSRPQFMANLQLLFPEIDTLPHAETLFRLLRDIDLEHLEQAHIDLVKPIRLLLDGLYANGPVMQRCRGYHWQFMIVLKNQDLSTVWQEFRALHVLKPQALQRCWGRRQQHFTCNELRLFDVLSAPDGTLLIFGTALPRRASELPPFAASAEVSERRVLARPEPLAFPLHTLVVDRWFAERPSRGGPARREAPASTSVAWQPPGSPATPTPS